MHVHVHQSSAIESGTYYGAVRKLVPIDSRVHTSQSRAALLA